jgi:2-aminoadipate transaminase
MVKSQIDYTAMLSEVGRQIRPNPIRRLTSLLGRKHVISLAAGAPSADTFPLEELSEIAARVIRERGSLALQYGPTRGPSALVDSVVEILRSRGMTTVGASEIVMTSGSQQGLDLISRVIVDPGDVVLVELPSYIGGIIAFHNARASMVGVRQDQDGIVIPDLKDQIVRLRGEGRRVKCIYTIPNFQNPSGVTLSPKRRSELIEIADEYDLLIIEDDAYFDLYLGDEARLTPLAAMRPDRVVYLGTFSKVLAPGLRTAYLRGPDRIAQLVEQAKEGADLTSSVLDQSIVAEAIKLGLIERRLPILRDFYRVRRDAMLNALDKFGPPGSSWTRPLGGFFILMQLDTRIDADEILPQAIDAGVAFVPGRSFFVDDSGANTIRLAYSKESPELIADGIERMCKLFNAAIG